MLGFALAAIAGACGSGDDDNTTTTVQPPPVSATTADRLAELSNRVAENLDAGLTCDAAHAADDLSAAVEESDLPANLRPGVETVATDLVNQVNCPPPPPPPEPEPEEEKKDKEKQKDEGDEDKDQHGEEGGNEGRGGDQGKDESPGHGGVPPGQAKLKGEEG